MQPATTYWHQGPKRLARYQHAGSYTNGIGKRTVYRRSEENDKTIMPHSEQRSGIPPYGSNTEDRRRYRCHFIDAETHHLNRSTLAVVTTAAEFEANFQRHFLMPSCCAQPKTALFKRLIDIQRQKTSWRVARRSTTDKT